MIAGGRQELQRHTSCAHWHGLELPAPRMNHGHPDSSCWDGEGAVHPIDKAEHHGETGIMGRDSKTDDIETKAPVRAKPSVAMINVVEGAGAAEDPRLPRQCFAGRDRCRGPAGIRGNTETTAAHAKPQR